MLSELNWIQMLNKPVLWYYVFLMLRTDHFTKQVKGVVHRCFDFIVDLSATLSNIWIHAGCFNRTKVKNLNNSASLFISALFISKPSPDRAELKRADHLLNKRPPAKNYVSIL